jgi:hypothetical protein
MPLSNDSFLPPRQRREAYLRNAAEAQGIADRSQLVSVRERYKTLALFWTTLANEVSGVVEQLNPERAL